MRPAAHVLAANEPEGEASANSGEPSSEQHTARHQSLPPDGRYDQALRQQIDKMLQIRAGVGGNAFALMLVWGVWGTGQKFWMLVAVCTLFAVFATVLARMVYGMMDRRIPNVGYFIGNTVYALAVMSVSDFAPHALFIVPVVILFYDGFSEGETRSYVLTMLAIFAAVPLIVGVPALPVVAAVGLGLLIHWFSEGRALTLRVALAEVKVTAESLRTANAQLQCANTRLEEQGAALRSNYERLCSTQEQLVQSEKLAGIGQLAAGVAHEINNPLSVILGFAQGMERRISKDSELRLPLTSIVQESLRCKDLVQELLTFSRVAQKIPERVDLNALLRGTAQLLESRARTQETTLTLDLSADTPELLANGTQIQQVVVNLGNNALDAMDRGGALVLRSRCIGDGSVAVEVQDTGSGIPENIRSRIFEPFFTTKEVGKGTGLGLSLVYEIATQHGGAIDVFTEIGRGTTMRLRLPVHGRASVPGVP